MEYSKKFKTLLIVGILLSIIILSLHIISSYNSLKYMKNSLIELGRFITFSFEISNRFIFSKTRNLNREKFLEFSKEFISNKSIYNLIIYTKKGDIIFKGRKKDISSFKLIFPDKEEIVEKEAYIVIIRKIEKRFRMGMMHYMMHRPNIPRKSEIYVALFLDKSGYNYFKKKTISDIAQIIILYLFMITILFYFYKLFNLYNQTTKRLKQAERNAELGKFSNLLAHEIKNPLSSISGLIEFLIQNNHDEKEKEILNRAYTEIQRLNSLVNDFLSFGKEIKLQKESFDLSQTVSDVLAMLQHDIQSKKIIIKQNLSPLTVVADKNKIIQVIMNLLINAIEATRENEEIKIELTNQQLIIINPNNNEIDKEKIFEPFYTIKTKGSGLGLTIVKKIIDLHGFKIYVKETKPFTIVLDFKDGR